MVAIASLLALHALMQTVLLIEKEATFMRRMLVYSNLSLDLILRPYYQSHLHRCSGRRRILPQAAGDHGDGTAEDLRLCPPCPPPTIRNVMQRQRRRGIQTWPRESFCESCGTNSQFPFSPSWIGCVLPPPTKAYFPVTPPPPGPVRSRDRPHVQVRRGATEHRPVHVDLYTPLDRHSRG
jgi:hypothetical protein